MISQPTLAPFPGKLFSIPNLSVQEGRGGHFFIPNTNERGGIQEKTQGSPDLSARRLLRHPESGSVTCPSLSPAPTPHHGGTLIPSAQVCRDGPALPVSSPHLEKNNLYLY